MTSLSLSHLPRRLDRRVELVDCKPPVEGSVPHSPYGYIVLRQRQITFPTCSGGEWERGWALLKQELLATDR